MGRLIDEDDLKDGIAKLPDLRTLNTKTLGKIIKDCPTIEMREAWIPCSERLPGKYELCLITQRIGTQRVRKTALYIIGEWKYNGRTLKNDSVIAWMPLPEPYREEKKDENP